MAYTALHCVQPGKMLMWSSLEETVMKCVNAGRYEWKYTRFCCMKNICLDITKLASHNAASVKNKIYPLFTISTFLLSSNSSCFS